MATWTCKICKAYTRIWLKHGVLRHQQWYNPYEKNRRMMLCCSFKIWIMTATNLKIASWKRQKVYTIELKKMKQKHLWHERLHMISYSSPSGKIFLMPEHHIHQRVIRIWLVKIEKYLGFPNLCSSFPAENWKLLKKCSDYKPSSVVAAQIR